MNDTLAVRFEAHLARGVMGLKCRHAAKSKAVERR